MRCARRRSPCEIGKADKIGIGIRTCQRKQEVGKPSLRCHGVNERTGRLHVELSVVSMNLEFDKVGVERSMIEGGAGGGGSREGPIAFVATDTP
jgi:hypothetical protein